ncbi:MAG: ORF6N domain-containing protein [Candidatus Zixiibacteriota bacterium]
MTTGKSVIPAERIENHIILLRGHKIMLSTHLAILYGVQSKALVQAVKRNSDRFPDDFMFQLSWDEVEYLGSQSVILVQSGGNSSRSQIVTLKRGLNIKYLPYAFTEQGVAMLSSVLKSKRAVQVNIEIMRAFVKLRQLLSTHADLARKLANLEKKYDAQFKAVFDAIRQLMTPPEPKRRPIGFQRGNGKKK